jgi:hypothetical protein
MRRNNFVVHPVTCFRFGFKSPKVSPQQLNIAKY